MLSLYDWFILYFLCCFIIIFLCSGFLVLAKTQQKYKKKKYELLYIESVLLPFYHTKLCFSFFLSFSRIICFLALLCLLADFKRNSFLFFFFSFFTRLSLFSFKNCYFIYIRFSRLFNWAKDLLETKRLVTRLFQEFILRNNSILLLSVRNRKKGFENALNLGSGTFFPGIFLLTFRLSENSLSHHTHKEINTKN